MPVSVESVKQCNFMGKTTGFLEYNRELPKAKAPQQRVNEYKEIYDEFAEEKTREQAARCMSCGVPFCHTGCPLGNNIPDFNDAVYQGDWELAIEILSSTNNFPEFTGRICPAPCEGSCVLGINKPAVAIEHIEKSIAEKAFELGYIKPQPPKTRTGKKIAVIGAGPAGLAAAAQLNKAGHSVTVFERDLQPGGLLRYGIPDFKLEKWVVERRVEVMQAEGVKFECGVNAGVDITAAQLQAQFDTILLTGGATIARDLPIPGRNLKGVHFAMEFLTQQNKEVSGEKIKEERILATGKNVLVIGGGDTGADCVGTSNRHKATSVSQLELLPQPPKERAFDNPWPEWPMILRTSSSHEEGCEREWAVLTKEFLGDAGGNLTGVKCVNIEWKADAGNGRPGFSEIPGTERLIPCELALLAVGFVGPQKEGLLDQLQVKLDDRGNVAATNYKTSVEGVYAAGDLRRGQSLVVWAIAEGREAARVIDEQLTGFSALEAKDQSALAAHF